MYACTSRQDPRSWSYHDGHGQVVQRGRRCPSRPLHRDDLNLSAGSNELPLALVFARIRVARLATSPSVLMRRSALVKGQLNRQHIQYVDLSQLTGALQRVLELSARLTVARLQTAFEARLPERRRSATMKARARQTRSGLLAGAFYARTVRSEVQQVGGLVGTSVAARRRVARCHGWSKPSGVREEGEIGRAHV